MYKQGLYEVGVGKGPIKHSTMSPFSRIPTLGPLHGQKNKTVSFFSVAWYSVIARHLIPLCMTEKEFSHSLACGSLAFLLQVFQCTQRTYIYLDTSYSVYLCNWEYDAPKSSGHGQSSLLLHVAQTL